jgi:tRNA-2-methylthio-N6-dimethylallyladenosine synthase
MPDVSIASDFIVGFPSETEDDFAQSMSLLRECRFKNSFIFKYSPRPGTIAIDRFADDVPDDVKRRRNNELLAVQQKVSLAASRQMIGQTVEVFVEGESKLVSRQAKPVDRVELGWIKQPADSIDTRTTQLVGRTCGDQVVCFQGEVRLKGQILDVQVTDAQNLTLFGKLVEQVSAHRLLLHFEKPAS